MNTVYAQKSQMTQAWDDQARRLCLTRLKLPKLVVTQIKTQSRDGYDAIQIGIGSRSGKRATKPLLHHLKAKTEDLVPRYLREIRLDTPVTDLQIGSVINPQDILHPGDYVTATGISKGRGFAGGMKRHGFKGGPKTHGQSDRERAPGAIGQGTSPGRIHKGKRMAGHFGTTQFTVKNLQVYKFDPETNTLWLKGTVPGSTGSLITLNKTGESKLAA